MNIKKIFVSVLAACGVATILSTTPTVYAGTQFNNHPNDLPTVMVANDTQNPCSAGAGAGCWSTSVNAQPGDIISVMVYYHNTSGEIAYDVALGMNPKNSSVSSTHTFQGGVLVYGWPDALGSATVHLSEAESLSFIPGSVRWFPNQANNGQTVSNESALFDNYGLSIGNVGPADSTQGTIVASFRVSGNNNTPTPNNDCRIDDFDADDYTIEEGDEVELTWHTTGCDEVKISPTLGYVNVDGYEEVEPNHTTTYTLTAYEDGQIEDTDTLTITVRDREEDESCSIDEFSADDYSITRGDSVRIRWETSGADSVDLTPGYANRSDDGSVTVTPSRTTTYTLYVDCDNGSTKTRTLTISVDEASNVRPQAVTTVATITGTTSAQLNGLGIPNVNSGTTRVWFEWGPSSSLGYRTSAQTIPSNNNSTNFSSSVTGLVPGTVYYYRAVIENQNGTAYGDIVRFQTRTGTVTTTPSTPTTIIKTQVVRDVVVAQSAPSLLELRVESTYDRMCVNGQIDYTITYRNISTQTLTDAVLQVTHQKEVTFISASRGDYDVVDRTITVALGDIAPGETGTILVHGRVNTEAIRGNLTVMTAQVVYTNTATKAQESAIAYSLVTVSEDCPNVLGASAIGFGSFLPDTLIEWLLLILIILALIVLGRQLTKKKDSSSNA
ncbi:hypothetical protein IT401_01770 [Candidatus Nomurabacteria bacterium]|nr:hypothetical protein [Candidatus Nomurabacteria bacterium]